jgi:L-threonine-O-3-phosphate decarboxylase
MEHGADIFTASKNSGINENDILDFSSNINPLGIPEKITDAIINSIKYTNRYPDINNRELVKSISKHENIPQEWIFCSNGAAEAIYRIALNINPKNGLLTAPTFSEYENALNLTNTSLNYYNLEEKKEFKINEDIIECINADTNIVFICNPNNPTGQITEKALLEKIIKHCKKNNTYIVIDECFLDFVENKDSFSVKDILNKYDNLIILKAFTKIYAIPGIRLGYCISSNTEIINGLKNAGPPWNVSTIAQAAGVAALNENEYVKKTVKYVKEQSNYLITEMKKLNIKTYEPHANYIFFKSTYLNLKEELLKKGILIRSCSNYENLSHEYYRIAVKTEEENKIFIDKLKEIMGNK